MHLFKKGKISKEEKKYIKFVAYDTLIEFEESSLPVLPAFDRVINSIFILPMQYMALNSGRPEDYYTDCGDGAILYVAGTGHYIVLYNEQLSSPEIRWTISKLIYLAKSGMLEDHPNTFYTTDFYDEESDEFAYQFTCPDVILNECGISNASDIIKHCGIPFYYANLKSKLLKKSNDAASLKYIEKILKNNFRSYINKRMEEF